MAENQENSKPDDREIPVFTVLKNSCILKNIFLLDNPPSIASSSSLSFAENTDQESEFEEVLVVGRHPECNIKLEHPSISRFHLRIHSKPASRSLYVTDLSSVHGTWISGKRIEPEVRIKMNEGDTLRLGGSSRLYRLHWVPLRCAYDVDKPFLFHSDVAKLDDANLVEEETEEEICQDEYNLYDKRNQVLNMSDNLEGLELLFVDDDLCSSRQKMIPTTPPHPEDLHGSSLNKGETEGISSTGTSSQDNETSSISPCECAKEKSSPGALFPPLMSKRVSQVESKETSGMKSEIRPGLSIWSRRGKLESVQIETSQRRENSARISTSSEIKPVAHENYIAQISSNADCDEQIFSPDKENCSPTILLVRSSEGKCEENVKTELMLNASISSVSEDDDEIFTPDKENMTPETRLLRSMKNFVILDVKHPQMSYRSSPLKRGVNSNISVEQIVLPSLHKDTQSQNNLPEWSSTSSTSKTRGSLNNHPSVLKSVTVREPFHPLLMNSNSSNKANSRPMRDGISIDYPEYEEVTHHHNKTAIEEAKRWIVVVDTGSLLNKRSRKALQLMRDLKGTSLIIPRIVVRELNCMLRGRSFFKRKTEVSAALQWIEDCMMNAQKWIHVQSSAEESRLVPPTPPAASPHWFNDEKGSFSIGSIPFSPYSLQEIVTPTAEDHILECALFFKQTRKDGQLVLLTDDVALKIKAMAEDIICETAEEFRGSLVNPFSPRFLYTNSSPRGPTWSCMDDTVLKEKYYPSPSKKLSKSGGVKGLKLILLHNSNFRQITPVS